MLRRLIPLGLFPLTLLMLVSACGHAASEDLGPVRWQTDQIEALKRLVDAAPLEALPRLDTTELDSAVAASDWARTNRTATQLATRLARAKLRGCAAPGERAGWNISDAGDSTGLDQKLQTAVAGGQLDTFFAGLSPRHPDYAALRDAYGRETDPEKRKTIARNLERWRWMPQSLGPDFVMVNTAAFDVRLWRNGKLDGTWPVVAGKVSSPTPVFGATITAVNLNPWWEIPPSIVNEMRGKLSRGGYVHAGNRWRQPPGPRNSLGQMKLVMYNSYNVYLHDTPSKGLFSQAVRAYSHGCVRVGDAMGFATKLLEGVKPRSEIDSIVASGNSTVVGLSAQLPVYITYFTAGTGGDGAVTIYPDVYKRDDAIADYSNPQRQCTPP